MSPPPRASQDKVGSRVLAQRPGDHACQDRLGVRSLYTSCAVRPSSRVMRVPVSEVPWNSRSEASGGTAPPLQVRPAGAAHRRPFPTDSQARSGAPLSAPRLSGRPSGEADPGSPRRSGRSRLGDPGSGGAGLGWRESAEMRRVPGFSALNAGSAQRLPQGAVRLSRAGA